MPTVELAGIAQFFTVTRMVIVLAGIAQFFQFFVHKIRAKVTQHRTPWPHRTPWQHRIPWLHRTPSHENFYLPQD